MIMNTSTLKRLLYAAFFTATTTAVSAEPLTQVTVAQGKLQGTAQQNLAVFKGVPFAKPPIGELRWKAPQPAEKWQGVLKAQEYAPAPIQAGNPVSGISEDSLYLNIWTPAESNAVKLPVLVWIY